MYRQIRLLPGQAEMVVRAETVPEVAELAVEEAAATESVSGGVGDGV